jgi:hypothetical protein
MDMDNPQWITMDSLPSMDNDIRFLNRYRDIGCAVLSDDKNKNLKIKAIYKTCFDFFFFFLIFPLTPCNFPFEK